MHSALYMELLISLSSYLHTTSLLQGNGNRVRSWSATDLEKKLVLGILLWQTPDILPPNLEAGSIEHFLVRDINHICGCLSLGLCILQNEVVMRLKKMIVLTVNIVFVFDDLLLRTGSERRQ